MKTLIKYLLIPYRFIVAILFFIGIFFYLILVLAFSTKEERDKFDF